MRPQYAKVNADGEVVIPQDIRHRLRIEPGTSIGFIIESERLILQPITDEFIDSMSGILKGRGLPANIEKERDRELD